MGQLRLKVGATWGQILVLGSVYGPNLAQVGVKKWLLGHLRGEENTRGRQGASKEQPGQNAQNAPSPFLPEIFNFHLRFGVPFWCTFYVIFGYHF